MYETAAFHSGFSAKDPNDFVKRFYKTYSKALGVLSLERKEIRIDRDDLELDSADYQGDNEEVYRVSPEDIKITAETEEDIVWITDDVWFVLNLMNYNNNKFE